MVPSYVFPKIFIKNPNGPPLRKFFTKFAIFSPKIVIFSEHFQLKNKHFSKNFCLRRWFLLYLKFLQQKNFLDCRREKTRWFLKNHKGSPLYFSLKIFENIRETKTNFWKLTGSKVPFANGTLVSVPFLKGTRISEIGSKL